MSTQAIEIGNNTPAFTLRCQDEMQIGRYQSRPADTDADAVRS